MRGGKAQPPNPVYQTSSSTPNKCHSMLLSPPRNQWFWISSLLLLAKSPGKDHHANHCKARQSVCLVDRFILRPRPPWCHPGGEKEKVSCYISTKENRVKVG